MERVTSKDGTSIAYDRLGDGPAVALVGGALVDRSENAPLAAELAGRFTTINYDRRGRGASGDTPPYALRREIEDLEALLAAARLEGSWPRDAAGTQPSCSCGWPAPPTRSWRGRGARRCGPGLERFFTGPA